MVEEKDIIWIEGEITHASERDRTDGQGKKYGIRINAENYCYTWLNGFGHCPFQRGDLAKVGVVFNNPYYNIVETGLKSSFVTADQIPEMPQPKIQTRSELPEDINTQKMPRTFNEIRDEIEKEAKQSELYNSIWQKTILEQNRALLMSKAVDLAIHWKSESTKAVKSIYHELLIESEQSELNSTEVKQ